MIKVILDNPTLAKQYGQAGRDKVLEKYTWEKISYQLEKVLVNCCK